MGGQAAGGAGQAASKAGKVAGGGAKAAGRQGERLGKGMQRPGGGPGGIRGPRQALRNANPLRRNAQSSAGLDAARSAARGARRAGKFGAKETGKWLLMPPLQVAKYTVGAAIVGSLVLLVALTAGAGSAGLPAAVPDNVAIEQIAPQDLAGYEQAGMSELVPWPVLAGIAHAATQNGAYDPYTGQPAAGPIRPGEGQSGGHGPLLLSPATIAAVGVDPHDPADAARGAAVRLSEHVEVWEAAGNVATSQMVELAGFNRDLIGDADLGLAEGSEWHEHIALWRDVLADIPDLVALPHDGACMVDLSSGDYTVPQQIHLAFTCAVAQAGEPDLRDPLSGDPYPPDVALSTLIREAVTVAWLHSRWGGDDELACDPNSPTGGVFPVPVGDRIMAVDLDTGEEVWTGEYTYERCDDLTNIRVAADLVAEREAVPFEDRPGTTWGKHVYGWQVFAGALGTLASSDDSPRYHNQFLRSGPADSFGQADNDCRMAAAGWASWMVANPADVPAGLAYVGQGREPATGMADLWLAAMDSEADELLFEHCEVPDHDSEVLDHAWAEVVRDALASALNNAVAPPASVYSARIKGLQTWLNWSLAGGVNIEPDWGVTSAVARLANPVVPVDVPTWVAPGQPQFADQAIAAALAFIGECDALPAVTGGTGAGVSTVGAGGTLEPELYSDSDPAAAVRAAYDVGLRGDTLLLAVAIAGAESGYKAAFDNGRMDNGGPLNDDGSIDYGLWQINGRWWDPPIPEIYDADVNAEFMHRISKGGQDWTPWVAYTNGSYRNFMDIARRTIDEVLGAAATLPAAGGDLPTFTSQPGGATGMMAPTGGATLCGPDLGGYTVPPTGASGAWGGHTNGQIPVERLCRHSDGTPARPGDAPSTLLECNAAQTFAAMNQAYRAHFGHQMPNRFGYRDYQGQVRTAERNCGSATSRDCDPPTARPGTSNHGWGLAIDMTSSCGTNNSCGFASPHFAWLQQNAPRFGFFHPEWAQRGGSGPEYWHWEFPAPAA